MTTLTTNNNIESLSNNAKTVLSVFSKFFLSAKDAGLSSITLVDVRKEIIEKFNLSNNTITSNIGVLKNKGLIQMAENNEYKLADSSEAVVVDDIEEVVTTAPMSSFAKDILVSSAKKEKEVTKKEKSINGSTPSYVAPQELDDSINKVISTLGLTIKSFDAFKKYQTVRFVKNNGFLEINVYENTVRILFKGKNAEVAHSIMTNLLTEINGTILDTNEKVAYSFITISKEDFIKLA